MKFFQSMFQRSAFFVGGSPVAPLKSQTNDSCSCRCCCLCGSQSHQLQIKPTGTYPYLYLAKQQPLPLRFHPEKTRPRFQSPIAVRLSSENKRVLRFLDRTGCFGGFRGSGSFVRRLLGIRKLLQKAS